MRNLLVLAVVVLAPSLARADAVGPPPTTCPPYGMPTTCHIHNGYCAPDLCASDAVCTGGAHCQPTPVCIATITCGSLVGSSSADELTGSCASGGCPSGSTCQMRNVCSGGPVDAGLLPDGGLMLSRYGCCSVAGTRGAAGGALVVLAVGALVVLRRRVGRT